MSDFSQDISDAKSWLYLAEGNHHVLFRYVGPSDRLTHSVLRLPKIMGRKKREYTATEEYSYYQNVATSIMTDKYLLKMIPIPVSYDFIQALHLASFALRPEHRRDKPINPETTVAFVMEDVTKLAYPLPVSVQGATWRSSIAIELKVKCGLRSTSPLAHPLKRQLSRYAFTQYVRLAQTSQGSTVPWGVFRGVSQYDPHLLCTRQFDHVMQQLQHLRTNPQNNMKISINGHHIYGLNISNLQAAENALRDALVSKGDVLSSLLKCVANVLCLEDVCERLEAMQGLDCIDVNGVALAYARLICLLNEDEQEAQSAVKNALLSIATEFDCPSNFMSEYLSSAESCSDRIQCCTISECIGLIQRWLLTLAACDASIVITLHLVDNCTRLDTNAPQEEGVAGAIAIDKQIYVYTVKCIDIGPKPVWKVKSHIAAEKELCELAELGMRIAQREI